MYQTSYHVEGFQRRNFGSPIENTSSDSDSNNDEVKHEQSSDDHIPEILYQMNVNSEDIKIESHTPEIISNIKVELEVDDNINFVNSAPLPFNERINNESHNDDSIHSMFTIEQYNHIIENVTNVTRLVKSLVEAVDKKNRNTDTDSSDDSSSDDDESSSSSDSYSSSSSFTSSVASLNSNKLAHSTNETSDVQQEVYPTSNHDENMSFESDASSDESFQSPAEKRIRLDPAANQSNPTSTNDRNYGNKHKKY